MWLYFTKKEKFTLEFSPKGLDIFHVTNLKQSTNNFTEIMDKIFAFYIHQTIFGLKVYIWKKQAGL